MDKFTKDYFSDNWHRLLWAFCLVFALLGLSVIRYDWGGWLALGMGVVAPVTHYFFTKKRYKR